MCVCGNEETAGDFEQDELSEKDWRVDNMLELKDVTYFYKSQKDKIVLDKISYQFEKGKLYAILGASGGGKTTLLSLLAGLDIPVEGKITV